MIRKTITTLLLLLTLALSASTQNLRIYAGEDYKDYLGKLGSAYDQESIWNKYSDYGNRYNSKSIWNKYSTYGNKYNAYSPWNPYTSNPPIIVDQYGRRVDYFSLTYKASSDMRKLVTFLYDHFDEIAKDPTAFYRQYLQR